MVLLKPTSMSSMRILAPGLLGVFEGCLHHLHGQAGRFAVWANGKQNLGRVNFVPESHLPFDKSAPFTQKWLRRPKLTALKKWNSNFNLESSVGKNRTISLDVSLLPEIFRRNDSKNHVPFTFQSDFRTTWTIVILPRLRDNSQW